MVGILFKFLVMKISGTQKSIERVSVCGVTFKIKQTLIFLFASDFSSFSVTK